MLVEYINIKPLEIFFSDKCLDPCEDVSCPAPHSECKVTDHEAQCLSTEQGNIFTVLYAHAQAKEWNKENIIFKTETNASLLIDI